jgi:uncharacterized protein (DUF1697 family)
MEALRACCESLKLRNPQTYVQSGNVVFKTSQSNLDKLAKQIETAIEKNFGFHSAVILRTTSEMRDIVAKNPFAKRRDIEPGKLLVNFLASHPNAEGREKVRTIKTDPEEMHLIGRELYIYFPNGMGRTKLPWATLDRVLKTSATGRNWNSVTKLLAMAEEMEAA